MRPVTLTHGGVDNVTTPRLGLEAAHAYEPGSPVTRLSAAGPSFWAEGPLP